ncbi:hypothetical protein O181_051419 [Austropuccinia psidii MF-1]|uniref:V-type proton ATPase subunit F n=1 Tax=Austropuccinia psidii MF-1 TaxID=1389203 RepID=A0A9Q3HQP5_9BASI|nr:hypothetical protein [Austropuccinia psidii MF-1]
MANTRLNGIQRKLIATIGDEDSITGFLLAGTGHLDWKAGKNFLVVDSKTPVSEIQNAFNTFTTERQDIAIVLINQHVADMIRPSIDKYDAAFPAVLEIPSKDYPYDPEKDSVLKRVKKLFGE